MSSQRQEFIAYVGGKGRKNGPGSSCLRSSVRGRIRKEFARGKRRRMKKSRPVKRGSEEKKKAAS